MNYNNINGQHIQTKIQKVLEKRNLWPFGGRNLECPKPKCFNYGGKSSKIAHHKLKKV